MPSVAARHQHRHYKTLIVLVLSMTGGTLFLYWVGRLAPVVPLRSKAPAASTWDRVLVRAQNSYSDKGFFHFRIDEQGRLYQSSEWKARRPEPGTEGAIQVLLSCRDPDSGIALDQARTLAQLISEVRQDFSIPADRITIEQPRRLADLGDPDL